MTYNQAKSILDEVQTWINPRAKYFKQDLEVLKDMDQEVRSEVQGFEHSKILGEFDDELDELDYTRRNQEETKEPLAF